MDDSLHWSASLIRHRVCLSDVVPLSPTSLVQCKAAQARLGRNPAGPAPRFLLSPHHVRRRFRPRGCSQIVQPGPWEVDCARIAIRGGGASFVRSKRLMPGVPGGGSIDFVARSKQSRNMAAAAFQHWTLQHVAPSANTSLTLSGRCSGAETAATSFREI